MCSSDLFLGLIAILFPPIAVWVKSGICSADSLINICLCMLGFLPGLLHAWYIIAKYPEKDYEGIPQDAEHQRITYVVVTGPNGEQRRVPKYSVQPQNQSYGATAPLVAPVHQSQTGAWHAIQSAGENAGPSNPTAAANANTGGVPPSYAEAVKGDHKVQSRD
ncbi:hypothetical protein BJ878DRAFT_506603 [Calycina marina]|uniref:Stress response RCI peptide n=1 Tax=Calycina marina TaxID=1763456 RepID=A0A9P7Z3T8_9HELO|nr:hypothetical protein BJ878DRAFT_506603 [Calycina marina]